MQQVEISSIQIETRQRTEFNEKALRDLAESIATKGLLHPIVLRKSDGRPMLVAGERRLRAVLRLHNAGRIFVCNGAPVLPGHIPALYLDEDVDEIRAKETELEENLIRQDLTWQERAKAISELHELRTGQNPNHTITATVKEIEPDETKQSGRRAEVRQSTIVARMLDDPEVAAARSLSEAEKIASRKIEAEFVAELDRRKRERKEARRSRERLLIGDAAEAMGTIPPGSIDAIIADPPYGMNAQDFGNAAKSTHRYDDTPDYGLAVARGIIGQAERVCKSLAHVYMFCDIELFFAIRTLFQEHGFDVFRTPLIWSKGSSGHAPWGSKGFRRQYELILFASRGGRGLSRLTADILDFPNVRDKQHAAQKPVELYEHLLGLSCVSGDVVLDPCCGSGTIFPAARSLSLRAIGIELDESTANQARLMMEGNEK